MISIKFEKYLLKMLKGIDKILIEDFGRRIGFVILLFEIDHPEKSNYISNQDVPKVKMAIKGMLARLYRVEQRFPKISKTIH